jgi:hypothetical protein
MNHRQPLWFDNDPNRLARLRALHHAIAHQDRVWRRASAERGLREWRAFGKGLVSGLLVNVVVLLALYWGLSR